MAGLWARNGLPARCLSCVVASAVGCVGPFSLFDLVTSTFSCQKQVSHPQPSTRVRKYRYRDVAKANHGLVVRFGVQGLQSLF